MRKKSSFFILVSLLIFSLTLTQAQEETGGEYSKQGAEYMDSGVIINTLVYDTAKINQDLTVYMAPYETSGKILDNDTISCRLGIISPDGSRLILLSDDQGNFTHIFEDDIWVGVVPGSFFNETGKYLYSWDCQETNRGGYFNGFIEVTKTGTSLEESEAFVLGILSFGILLLSIITFYFMLITPYSNQMNEKQNLVIRVTRTKYIKLGLILITYGLFTWFLNIMIGLSENFVSLTMYYGLFGGIFWIMNALSLPVSIIIIVIMLFEIVRDANIQKNIKALGSATR